MKHKNISFENLSNSPEYKQITDQLNELRKNRKIIISSYIAQGDSRDEAEKKYLKKAEEFLTKLNSLKANIGI